MTCASPGYHSTLLVFALGFLMAAIRFLAFNPASQRWFLAGADSWDLHAWVADGDFAGEELVFSDARRLGGGVTLTEFRYRFEQPTAAPRLLPSRSGPTHDVRPVPIS